MEHQTIHVASRKDFREWLRGNASREKKVSLVIDKKHTGKPSPSHKELMEEAICYGWIDTTINRLDENQFIRNFVKRNDKSRWSNNTLRYGKDLIDRGLMTKQGLKMYGEGLKKPTHDAERPNEYVVPGDLREGLKKSKKALNNWEKMAKSYKDMYLAWLYGAKRDETRARRIKEIVGRVREGKKWGD